MRPLLAALPAFAAIALLVAVPATATTSKGQLFHVVFVAILHSVKNCSLLRRCNQKPSFARPPKRSPPEIRP